MTNRDVLLAVKTSEMERTAAAITARRRGMTMAEFVRQLLDSDEGFRREISRMRRDSKGEELLGA